jgi:signal transduction histidine kinase
MGDRAAARMAERATGRGGDHATARLLRSSSFRLALQAAALSAAGALIVFVIIYNAAQGTVRAAIDATVAGEQSDILSDVQNDHKPMIQSVREAVDASAGTFYALTAPDGAMRAGNFTVTPQAAARWRGWATLSADDGLALPRRITAIRGLAARQPDGDTLYVAENASALHALKHLIAQAFLAVFGAILVLGLLGGVAVARGTFRRIEAITATSRDIMQGDLARRIALTSSGDEFDRLAASLNAMLERIQALMQNVQQVSNDIAHDLRSPLARLREHLEISRRDVTGAAQRAAFDEAILQVDTALGIFGALLRIAEVEAGARRRDFRKLDLTHLLTDLADTFETVAEAEAMRVSAAIAPGLAVLGDRELLTQMLVNIIENAIRHGGAGNHIRIEAAQDGAARLAVSIADHGPGVPEAERARILQRFVRLEKSRHSPGTGLGLPLAAAVAELHDGRITLSDNHPGLRVTITLPALPAAARPAMAVQIPAQ